MNWDYALIAWSAWATLKKVEDQSSSPPSLRARKPSEICQRERFFRSKELQRSRQFFSLKVANVCKDGHKKLTAIFIIIFCKY